MDQSKSDEAVPSLPPEVNRLHHLCAKIAFECSQQLTQPHNESIEQLHSALKRVVSLDTLPVNNKLMIVQMCLFICRCSTDTILKRGLSQQVDSLPPLLRTISSFYRCNSLEVDGKGQTTTLLLRIVSNLCMLMEKSSRSPSRYAFFEMLDSILSAIVEVEAFRKELYSHKNLPITAAIVHTCLEVYGCGKEDIRMRLLAARSLRRVARGAKRFGDTFQLAFVLPGIISKTHKVALTERNSMIIVEGLLVIANVIETTMNNRRYAQRRLEINEEEESAQREETGSVSLKTGNLVKNDLDKLTTTRDTASASDIFSAESVQIISGTLKRVIASVCSNDDYRVRSRLLDCVKFIYVRCNRVFGETLLKAIGDLGSILMEEENAYRCVHQKAFNLLRITQRRGLKGERLQRKLCELFASIKMALWREPNAVKKPFEQMCAVLNASTRSDIIGMMKVDRQWMEDLIECIVLCAVVDSTMMTLISIDCFMEDECVADTKTKPKLQFVCSRLKLRYDIGVLQLRCICRKLVSCGFGGLILTQCQERLEHSSTSTDRCLACEIISLLVLQETITSRVEGRVKKRTQEDDEWSVESVCKVCVDRVCMQLENAEFIETVEVGDSEVLAIRRAIQLCLIGAAFRVIRIERRKFRLLSKCMAYILEWRTSDVHLIRKAAEEAARLLVEGMCERSVSLLVYKYSGCIVSLMYTSDVEWEVLRSARVACSMMEWCDERAFFQTASLMNNQMMTLLDRQAEYSHTNNCRTVVLRAVTNFVGCASRWFSDEREESYRNEELRDGSDDTEGGVCDTNKRHRSLPQFVLAIEQILKRTRHLTCSRHLKTRLMSLQLVRVSLLALRYFPNTLCPLVHDNWPGVRLSAIGENLLARRRALKVIVAMCSTTGSFVYRRFKVEVWPTIVKYMIDTQGTETAPLECDGLQSGRRGATRRGSVFGKGDAYKYRKSILKHSLTIWKQLEASPEDWAELRRLLEAYELVSECSSVEERELALIGRRQLEELHRIVVGEEADGGRS